MLTRIKFTLQHCNHAGGNIFTSVYAYFSQLRQLHMLLFYILYVDITAPDFRRHFSRKKTLPPFEMKFVLDNPIIYIGLKQSKDM